MADVRMASPSVPAVLETVIVSAADATDAPTPIRPNTDARSTTATASACMTAGEHGRSHVCARSDVRRSQADTTSAHRARRGCASIGLRRGGTLAHVRTVILDPPTAGLEELLERRRRAGLDRLDEVWEGELHMVPAPSGEHADIVQQLAEVLGPLARAAGLVATMGDFNLGDGEHDYRVPDGGVHRQRPRGVWHTTAALIVEIISPGDETWEKLPFYAAHHVDEALIVNPAERRVHWLALAQGQYQPVQHSSLIELGPVDLTDQIDWPTVEDA